MDFFAIFLPEICNRFLQSWAIEGKISMMQWIFALAAPSPEVLYVYPKNRGCHREDHGCRH